MLPVYSLNFTARLIDLHPRTIMNWEKLGFIKPFRSPFGKRLFNSEDLKKLLLVKYLREEEKLNLPALKLLFQKNLIESLYKNLNFDEKLQKIFEEERLRMAHKLK